MIRALGCVLACIFSSSTVISAGAQQDRPVTAEGYVTGLDSAGVYVNDIHVTIASYTTFGWKTENGSSSDSAVRERIQPGAYVFVWGASRNKEVVADQALLRDDRGRKLSGVGVVLRVLQRGPDPLFEADGYRIRVTAQTHSEFTGTLKKLDDAAENTWIRYEGKRDSDGVLVATSATFLPPRTAKVKAANGLEVHHADFRSPGRTAISGSAENQPPGSLLGGQIKLTTFGNWRTIPDNPDLQHRIQRIGESLVPAYQKQLAAGDPSKINFSFYAVQDEKFRRELPYSEGLILIPTGVLDRLKTDDEIAAVLASGIAFELQRQLARIVNENRALVGAEAAAFAAAQFVPGLDIAYWIGGSVAANKMQLALEEQRGRISLALMSAAGYDPWKAPEAWRLLAPKHLPNDLSTLKYPGISTYQFGVLYQQYHPVVAPAQVTADTGSH